MSTTLTAYVVTRELERMRAFYEALGLAAEPTEGSWIPFRLGDATFALHGMSGDYANDPQVPNVSFGVDDIHATVARFEAQGAKILRGVTDETFGKMAALQDPDGRTFEVAQY